jgi:hypothetical protein
MSDKVDSRGIDPTLDDLLALQRRGIELDLRVAMPAQVVAFNPATQRASITLGLLPVRFVGEEEIVQAPIMIPGVPVEFQGGSLGYIATPVVPGDTGRVTFYDRAIAQWLLLGIPTDPINGRTHNLGDCSFAPGLRHNNNPIAPPLNPAVTLVEGPMIQLGVGATLHPVLGELLHAYLIAMFTAAPTAVLDGGATFKAALLTYLAANPVTSYLATRVTAI